MKKTNKNDDLDVFSVVKDVSIKKVGSEDVKFIFRINAEAKQQLNIVAAEEDKTKTAIVHEALNDLFIKYGKNPIA